MTLAELRQLTAGLPPKTRMYVLDFGGEPAPAAMLDPDELNPDDSAR